MKKVLHWPRLDTVLMVENTLKRLESVSSKKRLQKALRKKIMPQTLNVILEYLEESGKIRMEKRNIIWIKESEITKKYENLVKGKTD